MTDVKLSWVTLDRFVSEAARSDEAVRRQLEQNARPLRSQTAEMDDEHLLAKLSGLGVDADREKLDAWSGVLRLCDAVSARSIRG